MRHAHYVQRHGRAKNRGKQMIAVKNELME